MRKIWGALPLKTKFAFPSNSEDSRRIFHPLNRENLLKREKLPFSLPPFLFFFLCFLFPLYVFLICAQVPSPSLSPSLYLSLLFLHNLKQWNILLTGSWGNFWHLGAWMTYMYLHYILSSSSRICCSFDYSLKRCKVRNTSLERHTSSYHSLLPGCSVQKRHQTSLDDFLPGKNFRRTMLPKK